MSKRLIMLDGQEVIKDQAYLDSLTPGLTSRRGIFDTLCTHDQTLTAFHLHCRRTQKALSVLKIPYKLKRNDYRQWIQRLLNHYAYRYARVRLSIWHDRGRTHAALVVNPYKPFSQKKYKQGFRVMTHRKHFVEDATRSSIKSLAYAPYLKIFKKAQSRHYDEALLVNQSNHVVESTRSNVFWIQGNALYTPSLNTGCLAGVTRQVVLQIGRFLGLRIRQRRVAMEDLLQVEEAFLTNSMMGIMPLTQVDEISIGLGKVGPWTNKIMERYQKVAA